MADHTIDDLMQREIDGATSAADSARLQDILSRDPQARARYEELAALAAALARVTPVPPPPDLKDDIMAALPAGRYPTAPARWLPWGLHLRPVVQFGLALALGLALGVAASLLLAGGPAGEPGLDAVAGTLLDPAARGFRTVAEADVALPAAGGRARLSRSPAYLAVGLELAADAPARCGFRGAAGHAAEHQSAWSLRPAQWQRAGPATLVLEVTGPCRCVFFAPMDAAVLGHAASKTAVPRRPPPLACGSPVSSSGRTWTTILGTP